MEDIIGHILAGVVRGAIALGEAAADATKVIARGTVGIVKVVGEAIGEEIVEQALESIEG
ncbi:hypothetical protein ACFQZ1_03025 [Bacillus sp. CGMCC 1.60114]|uniref:hypothetical protein n=1 Tax=unclassified Bacillus (in: firmicutes) TaxID=185979 RepID=UPI0036318939